MTRFGDAFYLKIWGLKTASNDSDLRLIVSGIKYFEDIEIIFTRVLRLSHCAVA